jgi:hypothetical protein
MGQAVGVAAALAAAKGISPADMKSHIPELQQTLVRDDAYLPGLSQIFSQPVTSASLTSSRGDPEPIRNGINRPVGDNLNCWTCEAGDWLAWTFQTPTEVTSVTAILDSGLNQNIALNYRQKYGLLTAPPDVMPKAFRIEGLIGDKWEELIRVEQNHQRLCRFPMKHRLNGICFRLDQTWGSETSRVYAFYFD